MHCIIAHPKEKRQMQCLLWRQAISLSMWQVALLLQTEAISISPSLLTGKIWSDTEVREECQ